MSIIVNTKYGKVSGSKEGRVYSWKGIPFAKPPTGDLRFQPPESPESWSGVLEATEYGPAAMQLKSIFYKGNVSEDCLYLNIWSPGIGREKKPVMVWIHGGGFTFGSGGDSLYNGHSFADLGDVVVVTFNYRLGPLGFLNLSDIGGSKYESTKNLGMLDQIAALKWVKENIEQFGGDPDRVTIFGESAGARSVGLLLSMPIAEGLFDRAIIQSGALSSFENRASSISNAEKLLNYLEIDEGKIHKLLDLPAKHFLEAVEKLNLGIAFSPFIDGEIIPRYPLEILETGISKDIPVMIGTTLDEFRFNVVTEKIWKQLSDTEIIDRFEQMSAPFWSEISGYYLNREDNEETILDKLIPIMTYHIFVSSAFDFAEEKIKQKGAPIWLYRFDWQSPAYDGELRAGHSVELPFVWNQLNNEMAINLTGDSENRKELAYQMHKTWIAFAHNGDPNNSTIPNWQRYDSLNRPTMLFDTKSEMKFDPYLEERQIWDEARKKLNFNNVNIEFRPTLKVSNLND